MNRLLAALCGVVACLSANERTFAIDLSIRGVESKMGSAGGIAFLKENVLVSNLSPNPQRFVPSFNACLMDCGQTDAIVYMANTTRAHCCSGALRAKLQVWERGAQRKAKNIHFMAYADVVRGRLPRVPKVNFNGGVVNFTSWEHPKLSLFDRHIRPQLAFGRFLGDVVSDNSSVRGPGGENEGHNQKRDAAAANVELPLSKAQQFFGRIGHGFLRHKIGFFAILGSLAAGIAGWPAAYFIVRGKWAHGFALLIVGSLAAVILWNWGLYDSPLAFIDRGRLFFNRASLRIGELPEDIV